jgi:hypothetical protein
VRVRVLRYERTFPAKPVRSCDGSNEPRAQWTSKERRTRQCPRHGAVSPDNRDMHAGRERPPEGRAWGEEGGSKMGVAHALLAALLGCDSGADSRPAAQSAAGCRREAADGQEDRASVIVQRAMRQMYSATVRVSAGDRCSRVFVPPPRSPLNCSDQPVPGKARRAADCQGDGCYGRFFDQRRGSTLTRVAASSIESSAPRSMCSRCASRA